VVRPYQRNIFAAVFPFLDGLHQPIIGKGHFNNALVNNLGVKNPFFLGFLPQIKPDLVVKRRNRCRRTNLADHVVLGIYAWQNFFQLVVVKKIAPIGCDGGTGGQGRQNHKGKDDLFHGSIRRSKTGAWQEGALRKDIR
jgi:hypothetical protein